MKKAILGGGSEDDQLLKEHDKPTESGEIINESLNEKNGFRDNNSDKECSPVQSDKCQNERIKKISQNSNTNDDAKERQDSSPINKPKEKAGGKTDDESSISEPGRRSSTRLQGKRPKLTMIITSSDEENFESSDDELYERKKKETRRPKKSTPSKSPHLADLKDVEFKNASEAEANKPKLSPKERKISKNSSSTANKQPKEFASGTFVVLKSDFHASTTPAIWKIDGKALLQKFVHFDQNGQTLYKNTSTYSGWTFNNRELYYPATVETVVQSRKETIVKFKRETIVDDDSD